MGSAQARPTSRKNPVFFEQKEDITHELGVGEQWTMNGGLFRQQRHFVVFIPKSLQAKKLENARPLLFLFHGTDQQATQSSMWQQHYMLPDKRWGWQELADQQQFFIIFGQAAHAPNEWLPSHEVWLWAPGEEDIFYVNSTLDFVLERYPVDRNRVYACGHSNGGLFISDIVLHIERFAAACNHMGGIEIGRPWMEQEDQNLLRGKAEQKFAIPRTRKTPLIIITGTAEDNRGPCHDAKKIFQEHDWPIEFEELAKTGHDFAPTRPELVWNYLSKYTLAQPQCTH